MQNFEGSADAQSKLAVVLGSSLGIYHYKDGAGMIASIPAIWVVHNMDEDPPADHNAEGLECLIFPPQSRGDPFYSGNTQIFDNWEIRLIQHDRKQKLRPALLKMLKVWLQAKVGYLRQSKEIDEQATITITQWETI